MVKHKTDCKRAQESSIFSVGVLLAGIGLTAKPKPYGELITANTARAIGIGALALGSYMTYRSAKKIKKKCYYG